MKQIYSLSNLSRILVILTLSSVISLSRADGLEMDTDRLGMDYRRVDLSAADPSLCQTECGRDGECKAFTYVKPGLHSSGAVCYLKNGVPPPTPNTCCISGLPAVLNPAIGLEIDTDRLGMDYRRVDLSAADPSLCQTECGRDGECKAFTYVKPGLHSSGAVCYLKNEVPPPTPNTCCISGLSPLRNPEEFKIFGWADLHTHPFAYEGFGGDGSVFYGKAYGPLDTSLPHCEATHGLGGINDLVGMAMHINYTHGFQWGHLTSGNPEFVGWPRWDDVTHQSMHEDWLKRAVDGGMRLMVAHAVNNEWMCATAKGVDMTAVNLATVPVLATGGPWAATAAAVGILGTQVLATQVDFIAGNVRPDCKDMPSVDRQIGEAYRMQSSIDAHSGGPGRGWFRIVKSPVEAKDVMSQGKLAVILGIEVDNLFGCYVNGTCTEAIVRQQLDRYFDMGVRHVFPIHFYDNDFGGSANSNFLITSRWKNPMDKRNCQTLGYTYDRGQCNAKGLTNLGKFLIRELTLRGMIIDTDHMSAKSFSDAMDILEPLNYPVVSGHTGFTEIGEGDKNNEGNRTPIELQRIRNVQGMTAVIPHQGDLSEIKTEAGPISHECGNTSETVAQAYLYAVHHMPGQPVGIGTDFNGFAGEPGPRFGPEGCAGGIKSGYRPKPRLNYPFTITTISGSITMDRGVIGQRVYDFNTDGLAHIGLVPDMIADFRAMGMSPQDLDPLFDSASGYVRLWDHARESSKNISGIKRMTVEVFPRTIMADTPQSITVKANDVYLNDPLVTAEVWIGGNRVGSLGQQFMQTITSKTVPKKCHFVREGDDPPRKECEPAHKEATSLEIEVRATNYANGRASVYVSVPE